MFLMIGMTQGRKDLSHEQLIICPLCGRYGRYRVFVTFTQLLLFFIPCFRWGRKYYVEMNCCGATYALDPAVGKRIESGENVQIRESDLTLLGGTGARMRRRCPSCGFYTEEDFAYCPKCGTALE